MAGPKKKTAKRAATKKPRKKKADVIDLQKVKAEIDSLKQETMSYGYSADTEDLGDLRRLVVKIREEFQGKPPCYRRMYSTAASECRICDEAKDCGADRYDGSPEQLPAHTICKLCSGLFDVPLKNDAGEVEDMKCSSKTCYNTLLIQQRWDDPDIINAVAEEIPDREMVKRRTAPRRGATEEEIADQVIVVTKQMGVVPSLREYMRKVRAKKDRVTKVVAELKNRGVLVRDNEGYRLKP